jgi:ketosteroid isomerase-like protein
MIMKQSPDEFMAAYERATGAHDLKGTLALIADDALYWFSDESTHAGKAAIKQVLERNFKLIHDETFSLANLTWLVRSAEAAVCLYDFSWSGIVGGKLASGSGRGTTVLRRAGEGWEVIHEHLSKGKSAS